MRVSREQAAENHERIVAEASRLFRERGFDAIGVDALMKAAGFTHGGFYGHFRSKEDLIAEAVRRGLDESASTLARHETLESFLTSYLSGRHRDDVRGGCSIAANGGDMGRQGEAVRGVLSSYLRLRIGQVTKLVSGRSEATRRRKAIAALSGAVGALVLARAVQERDLSDEILAAGRTAFGEAFGPPARRRLPAA